MKLVVAIFCSLLLVLPTRGLVMSAGDGTTDSGMGCHGCGCAAATCCSAADRQDSEPPAVPPLNDSRLGGLKLPLSGNVAPILPSFREPLIRVVSSVCDRAITAVPRYLRVCAFLI